MLDQPNVECWTALSALAGTTERIRLGTMVLCNSFRNPALTAKMAATIDNVSGGRLEFGIGAGWKKDEYIAYGYDFPEPAVRIRQLEEGIKIARRMWRKSPTSFEGRYYRVRQAYCAPQPVQERIPITVGGAGEQMMLRLVAKYADRSNWWICPEEQFVRRLKILRSNEETLRRRVRVECSATALLNISSSENGLERNLRSFHEWTNTSRLYSDWLQDTSDRTISGLREHCIEVLERYVSLGVEYFMVRPIDLPSLTGLTLFADAAIRSGG